MNEIYRLKRVKCPTSTQSDVHSVSTVAATTKHNKQRQLFTLLGDETSLNGHGVLNPT